MSSSLFRLIFLIILFQNGFGWSEPEFNVAWRAQSEMGFSGPNELRDTTGKTIGIVVSEVGQGLICFSADGQRIWSIPMMTPPVTAGAAIGDLDGNGSEEIVAADGGGNLYLIDAQGTVLWTAKTHAVVQAESCPVLADLDGDGFKEILVGDQAGGLNCLDRKGKAVWTFIAKGDQIGLPLVADLYDLPGCEVIVTSHNGHIYALSAKGEWLWQLYHEKECLPWSLPILADVEGDGKPEVYVGGGLHHFIRIDPAIPAIVLDENVYLHINTTILTTDLEEDGKDEVIFGVKGGKVFCYGEQGFVWTRAFQDTWMNSTPLMLNLDQDSFPEFLFTNCGLKLLEHNGEILKEFRGPSYSSQPLAGDFNQDGLLDLVLCGYGLEQASGLVFQKWNLPYQENERQWITIGGARDHHRKHPRESTLVRYDAPSLKKGEADCTFAPVEKLRLFADKNEWQFDVNNPEGRQLVLLLELAHPDGSPIERFANHIYSGKERTSMHFEVAIPGIYQVTTSLIDTRQMQLLSSHQTTLQYSGPSHDMEYVGHVLSQTSQRRIDLEKTNPKIASHIKVDLDALYGQGLVLQNLSQRSPQTPLNDPIGRLIRKTHRLNTLVAAAEKMAATGSFAAYRYCPWAYFDPVETLPEGKEKIRNIRTTLCQDEYDSQALNVVNFTGTTLNVRVWAEDLRDTPGIAAGGHLELRRAVIVPTIRSERVADALPLLDQAGILPVPIGETQQLWLTFNAKGLQPGKYTSTLHLKSVEPDSTHLTIAIEVEVFGIALPSPSPLKFCVWSYAEKQPDFLLQDLIEHGVNVHFAPSPSATCNEKGELVGSLDFSAHDPAVTRFAPHGKVMFVGSQGNLSGQPMFSEAWNRAFVAYLRTWIAHLKELGIDYTEFALYPYDEPASPFSQTSQNLVKVAKLIREADPNIWIYTDPTSGTTWDSLRMWEGLIDIWCPSAELLERFGEELLPFAKKTGKETWFYDASGRSRTLSCLGLYRWRFWYAWNLGLTGVGWWTYTHGDYLWDGHNPEGDYFYHVYDASGAIVTSKRWEAAREGIEDYELLFLLREALVKAAERGVPQASLQAARTVLAEVPLTIEKTLHSAGRRLPLDVTSVPLYEGITETLQQARQQVIECCLQVNALGR